MMAFRVFSSTLDPTKKWYALNTSICGGPPRKFAQNEIFELFKGEVLSRSYSDLKDNNGRRVSREIFNDGKRETPNVYVGTTFAIIVGNVRRKRPSDSDFLCSTQFLRLKQIINGEAIEIQEPRPQVPSGFSLPSTPDTSFSDCSSSSSLGDLSDLCTSSFAEDAKDKITTPKLAANFCPPFSSSPLPMKRKFSNSILSNFSEETTDESNNYKRRKIREKASSLLNHVNSICDSNNEELSSVIARCCINRANEGSPIIKDVFTKVENELGVQKTFENLIPDELWGKAMHSFTVPDWQLLLMKLEIPISDDGWQAILNRTHLGKCSRSTDSSRGSILLSKNRMKAIKSFVFEKVEGLFGIEKVKDEDIPGYQVGLEPVVCWQARELRLQGYCRNDIQLNLKLDGRPFGGRSQVLVGVIPTETVKWSNHSCKSFFPLAIANCKEDRVTLQQLISKLNREKDAIKRNGIRIDGQLLNVRFKVTLDLKALYLLLVKDDDENFQLGGKGLSVEFCFFCRALRNCKCDLGPDAVCLTHLSETKANIGSFKGIRDDLTFLLEEDLTSINLCALHCELRNTEQLRGSLGLYAFRIGALKDCNAALAKYGPETSGDRIRIKMKEGQQTVAAKHNIQVTSFSGNTERNILRNIEEIVHESLPLESLKEQFRSPNLAKEAILNKIAFCSQQMRRYEQMMKNETFTRDYGKYEEEIPLKGSVAYEKMVEYRNSWEKSLVEMKAKLEQYSSYLGVEGISQKRDKKKVVSLDGLSEYAAQVTQEFYIKVFTSWREIATIIRKGVFSKDQQHLIDEYDLQCKDWGFLLREMFGPLLGTGDYGHMTIEHSSMLLRVFGSIREYSNQSIEAAHSLQRQLYSKATSHDRHGYISSIRQLLLHFYSERILFLRLCFRNALQCTSQGKPFHFVGCGWTMAHAKTINWSTAEIEWIKDMDNLMTKIFGDDYLEYESDKITKTVCISPQSFPEFVYDHNEWEDDTANAQPLKPSSSTVHSPDNPSPVSSPTVPDVNKASKVQIRGTQPSTVHSPDIPSAVPPPTVPDVKKAPFNLYPDLKRCTQRNLTRRELASLELPPVVHLSKLDLDIVQNPARFSNPLVIAARPPDSIVQHCKKMLQQHRTISSPVSCDDDDDDDDDDDELEEVGIQVGGLGVFNRHSINIWTSAAQASIIKEKVGKEMKWLANNNGLLSHQQQTAIENVLLDSRPTEEILAVGDSIVDVNDLSTLVAERYLTGFLIDVSCLKFKEQTRSQVKTIYLPTSFQSWASTGDIKYLKTKISQYTKDEAVTNSQFLLTPINVSGVHWGLLCLDLKSMQAYYDDGLHCDPPDDILDLLKCLLKTLNQLAGSRLLFNEDAWNLTLPLKRFGDTPKVLGLKSS